MKRFRTIVAASNVADYFQRWNRLWQRLVEPPTSVKDAETRRRSRLFNGLLVAVIPVIFIMLCAQLIIAPRATIVDSGLLRALVLGVGLLLLIYLLNRVMGHYRLVSYFAFGMGFVAIFVNGIASFPPHIEIGLLVLLPLVSTVLFSLWTTFFLSVLTTVCLLVFAVVVRDMPLDILEDMLTFTTLTQAFIIFVAIQRNRLEKDRQHLALERARNELLTTLINNLSHDFRTPLTVINTSAYLLAQSTQLADRQQKVDQITQQTQRLNRILDDILAISRLEHEGDFSLQKINLNEMLHTIFEQFREAAESKRITLAMDFAQEIPPVLANWDELHRAFSNLVENAVQYTPSEGSITIRTLKTPYMAVVEVTDTGSGIEERDLPLIFDYFFRGDKARSTERGGTGLGLSIVKRVIELHEGSIEVESAPGVGSTFRVSLPVVSP